MWNQGKLEVFWDDEYKNLNYRREIFNNPADIERWRKSGYKQDVELFSGLMCPHGEAHPEWTKQIINYFQNGLGLNDIGVCFYKMETGVILPMHSDHYNTYLKKFNVTIERIHRVLIFLEDWKSGHYFEVDGTPLYNYKAGSFAYWNGDTKHMAANIGEEDRYTLQITGWK
jgi:hypothetical protein